MIPFIVADSLRRAGIDVWVDFENIRGGDDWLCEIQAGIERCDAVVVALSKASAESVWVERECLYAWQLNKPVFTALIADILIPLHLINIQYCDLRQHRADGMAKLVKSIQSALETGEGAGERGHIRSSRASRWKRISFPSLRSCRRAMSPWMPLRISFIGRWARLMKWLLAGRANRVFTRASN